ncbi:hypothetical protein MPTK1_6g02280 [Marchantia polymorpha subsp. ruderalis]|uniref:Uncharacterized protein n=2 Tax=Marchantia polymorpha TaxID=3197 RepID=A0AAF6BMP2_MARPO|nr:hypothetical protein MARPO_0035s0013 [Marchantia polymorpha]BBN13276.1 hypothetical protein Mp_6g02280 [Marchantia polymorpha subsp. ruderalis]|eukprot:PTQ41202.1 hypothetical protein MARPO_0035s0013 [Marchantia polymorpha]
MSECFLVIETAVLFVDRGSTESRKRACKGQKWSDHSSDRAPMRNLLQSVLSGSSLIAAPGVLPAPVSSHAQDASEHWIERLRILQGDRENEMWSLFRRAPDHHLCFPLEKVLKFGVLLPAGILGRTMHFEIRRNVIITADENLRG